MNETDRPAENGNHDLMREADVAVLLNVTPSFLRQARARGDLPAFRLGPKLIRYRRGEVMDFLTRSRLPASVRVLA